LAWGSLEEHAAPFVRAFFNSPVPVGISRLADRSFVEVNESFLRLFEYAREEVIGATPDELGIYADPGDGPRIRGLLKEHGTIRNYEMPARTRTGRPLVLLLSADITMIDGTDYVVATAVDFTQRKAAEERANHLATFPELNPNPVMEVSASGEMIFCNPGSLRVVEELGVDRSGCEGFLPGDMSEILEGWDKEHESALRREVSLGDRVFAKTVHLVPQFGAVRIYAHDITQRKRMEEALRESERQMNRAQEIAHLGSWELDLVNNRLSWSDEVYRIFGMQPQEFGATYEAFLDAVHPEDRAAVDAAYSGSLREGRDTYEIEHRVIRRSNGEVRTVHEKCEHLRDSTGRIIKSVGMVHDITGQRKAEEALRESEKLYRNIVDTATEGIWIGDNEARTTFVNKRLADMLGYSPAELTGRLAFDFMDEEARVLALSNLDRRLQGLRGSYEQKYLRKDGATLWALVSAAPLCDKHGDVVGSLAILYLPTSRTARRRTKPSRRPTTIWSSGCGSGRRSSGASSRRASIPSSPSAGRERSATSTEPPSLPPAIREWSSSGRTSPTTSLIQKRHGRDMSASSPKNQSVTILSISATGTTALPLSFTTPRSTGMRRDP